MSIKAHVEVIDGKIVMTGKLTKRDTDKLAGALGICQSLEVLLPEEENISTLADNINAIIKTHGYVKVEAPNA